MRRKTKQLMIGNVPVGGDAPIAIQSMTNTPTEDYDSTIEQIKQLAALGCALVRIAVPNMAAADMLPRLIKASPVPLIADIHFDYRLALLSLESGIAALRLNPGNIGAAYKVSAVAKEAKARGVPIRVGVNSGSLAAEVLTKYGGPTPEALVDSALTQIRILEDENFDLIKISLKCSRIPLMLEAYRLLAGRVDYPFHIGVTEAGTLRRGTIKSAVGIGALLAEGLGDTLRVSLAGSPLEEVFVAKEILRSLGLYHGGVDYIVCPTCGRTKIDLPAIAERVEKEVDALNLPGPLTVAVMGCVVNGPGEAREADVGIAGGQESGMLFIKGQEAGRYPADQLVDVLLDAVKKISAEKFC